jgi:hypothetical protein
MSPERHPDPQTAITDSITEVSVDAIGDFERNGRDIDDLLFPKGHLAQPVWHLFRVTPSQLGIALAA